jgi:hypothetical protein
MKININLIVFFVILLLQVVLSRPTMQKIVIDNHEWQVPNEPGWEELIKIVAPIQKRLASCVTPAECRRITEEMRSVFYEYPVSKNYFDSLQDDVDDIFQSIFKWG